MPLPVINRKINFILLSFMNNYYLWEIPKRLLFFLCLVGQSILSGILSLFPERESEYENTYFYISTIIMLPM